MNLSVCLEANAACQTNVQVLKNAVLPKVNCDWDVEFVDPGMSILIVNILVK